MQVKQYGLGTLERLPSGRIRVRVPDGRGSYKSLGTYDTEEEALRMRAAGALVREHSPIAQTVAEYGEIVIARWKLAGKRSASEDHSRWRALIVKHAPWAHDSIDGVSRGEIREWSRALLHVDSALGKPLSNQTIKHAMTLVRRVFAEAVEDELIEANPAKELQPPKRTDAEQDAWMSLSVDEIEHVLNHPALTPMQRTAFALAIYTGLREGELAAVRLEDVRDLDGLSPHFIVRRSWGTTTKTRRTRRVDLVPSAVVWLRGWLKPLSLKPADPIWGRTYAEGYDWGWADTKDYTRGICRLGLRRQLGITRPLAWRHLRDTCASHLLSGSWGRSWTIAEVAGLLGHTTTWVTERYARVLPGALAKAAAATYRAAKSSHEPSAPVFEEVSQVVGTIGRAMQDSNPRLLAPEASALIRNPGSYGDHGGFMEVLAARLLQAVADGQEISDCDTVTLACAVLTSPDVTLAARIVDGGPLTLTHAIELAGLVLRRSGAEAGRVTTTESNRSS